MTQNSALSIIDIKNPLQVFTTPNGLDFFLDQIEEEVNNRDMDISTKNGRDEIRSLARRLATCKTKLDEIGKELTEGQRKLIDSVNEERRRVWERLEKLQHTVRQPLTDWENAEKERVAAHELAVKTLERADVWDLPATLEAVKTRLAELAPFYEGRQWQEFQQRAAELYDAARAALGSRLEQMVKAEEEAAELARLREVEAERQQQEREALIAANAKAEAERVAKEQADALAARVKAEQEAAAQREQEAAERAKRAESERLEAEKRAEDEPKAAAERAKLAETAAREAQEKAERDRIAAEEKAKADQAAAVEAAAKAERDRIAAEQEAERKALAKREADKAHKAKINNEAATAILRVLETKHGEPEHGTAKAIIVAIAKGEIPHVKINY